MITILSDVYGNDLPDDILNSDFELIKTLNLDVLLTPSRTNGVFFMLKVIKNMPKHFQKLNLLKWFHNAMILGL